jgi:dolichol-phosphate mannosyltransferase
VKRIAIATPTYNEANNITKLIYAVKNVCTRYQDINFTLLVIDDNSPDGTGKIADKVAAENSAKNFTVQVLHRKGKEGFGKAYVNGFNVLLDDGYDYIIQMDADLSHNPKYLREFIKKANENCDFVVATRYIKGGGTPDWGLHRKILSRGGNIYTRLFLGSKITDYTGGFNMYSSSLLKSIDTEKLTASGYGFLIELKYKALLKSKNYAQFPIIFKDRLHGKSKIPRSTLVKNFMLVPKLKFASNEK